ncbi:hypothetical protein C5S31_11680 [ANME-1 cluster archaeon GoMg2]|nr:hypothetical protein [ANME-1 cluster archaeon GoMg2]
MKITNDIKISIYQIYQCIFKPITFTESIEHLDKKSKMKLILKLSFLSFIISIVIVGIIRAILMFSFGYPFDWFKILYYTLYGITLGIVCGIALGIALGIAPGSAFGTALGIGWGIVCGIAFGIVGCIVWGIVWGIAFLFSYFRVFYILPHMIQYLRVRFFKQKPFRLFRNSPIYWDELILMPLPFLSNFLVTLTKANREEGLSEIEFVSSKRPFQRKAASSALSEITIKDMGRFKSIEEIADASGNVPFLYTFESSLSREFGTAGRNIEDISTDAKSYLESSSNYNKLRNLNVLGRDVDKFKETLIATKGPVGYKFLPVAETWSQIIKEETNKLTELKKDTYEEIPNPYIFGNPVRPEEKSRLFVGRQDIIREIESNLANISQNPTLFLHGRRRVGKSSVLINLPRFLGKRYVSAYIDCQDPRTTEGPASFCYTLSKSISNSLKDRGFSIEYPLFEAFQKNPFTILGNWFDKTEKTLETENKLILLALDEYEKLEESILRGNLSIEILDQLRNIIQHRKHFVVLITGSKELNELELNWSDYLISAKTIKLGYLSRDEARILITNPIDDFSLNYEGGENGEVVNKIIDVTSCQPYLVQALCFDLVNYLNTQHRKEAQMADIDAAIEKVLISADTYFYYIWNSECSEKEKELLKRLVSNLPLKGDEEEINSLMRKEIIENVNGNFRFKVELMKKWIEKNN